jgi:hypothetical protein
MSDVVFEKAFSFSFTPTAGDEPVNASDLVSARIYRAKPSTNEREDHTNALATAIQYVTDPWRKESDYERVISFAAVSDLTPTSGAEYEIYYIVVSFTYDAGGTTVASEIPFTIWRPNGIASRINVAPKDIYALESKIEQLKEMNWVFPKIEKAKRRVLRRMQGLGFKRTRMREEDLNDAVIYLAVADCCRDLAGDGNPFWMQKAGEYQKEFEEVLSQESLGYDTNSNGVVEPAEVSSVGSVYLMR